MDTNVIIPGDILIELAKLPDECAQAIICDPPYYNVLEQEDWDTQWPNSQEYLKWCDNWAIECMRVLKKDGLCFIFGQVGKREHTFIHLMSRLCNKHIFHDLVIWDRAVGYNVRRDSFTPQYEMILVLRKSDSVKFNKGAVREPYDSKTIELYLRDKRYKNQETRLKHLSRGKYATNIQKIPSLKGNSKEKCGHPSQKPIHLIERLILCSTDKDDLVIDPFIGSGTTAVVAKMHSRKWLGVEANARYIKIAKKRIKNTQSL